MSDVIATVVSDKNYQASGSYSLYLSPWGAGGLVQGTDYWDTATFSGPLLSSATTMNWKWPEKIPVSGGVYNFNFMGFGNYNYNNPATIISSQVSNIATLTQSHSISLGGDSTKYDVITDFFLTSKPNDFSNHLFEVEIFEHTPAFAKDYVNLSKQIGTYTDNNKNSWTVSLDKNGLVAPNILIMPKNGGDILSGSIDIKGMFDWLTSKGVLTGKEYFNGLGMGAEVRQGTGSLTISRFSVDYSVKGAPDGVKVEPFVNKSPIIDSNGGKDVAEITVGNASKSVTTVHAIDPDGTKLIYAIKGGADAAAFTVDAITGVLSFKGAPSYWAPKDAGGDNIYNVTVQTSDGNLTDSQDLAISIASTGTSSVFTKNAASVTTIARTTEHYDGNWNLTRISETDVVRFDGKILNVESHDAAGRILGNTQVLNVDGREVVQHFDAKWAFQGADQTTFGVKTVTTHFDKAWKETGHDMFYFQDGKAIEQNFDASWKLISADIATLTNGSKVIDHYDSAWKAVGHDIVSTSDNKIINQHFDSNWKFTGSEIDQLTTFKALHHDAMAQWLLS